MGSLRRKLDDAGSALTTLEALSDLKSPSEVERDAAIQRFEYTFETMWKAAQEVLVNEGIEANSPRAAIRACFSAAILDEEATERALALVADRNLSVHTYKRALAEELFGRLSDHARLFRVWLEALEKRVQDSGLPPSA